MKTPTKSLLTAAAVAALTMASAGAAVIVNGFDALTWYDTNTSSGHNSTVSGSGPTSTLGFTSSTATDATNIATGYFTATTLSVGETMTLSFDITVNAVADQNNNFRFGLFNSNGTQLTADATGSNPPNARNAFGYVYRMATDPSSPTGNVSRYYFTQGNGTTMALTSNNGGQTQLGSDVGTGTILSNTTRSLKLELTRTNATDLTVEAFIDGNLLGGGRTVTGAPTFTFDQIAFSMVNTNSVGYTLGNLQVTVIPEPTTWALLAGGLTALVVFRKHRRA